MFPLGEGAGRQSVGWVGRGKSRNIWWWGGSGTHEPWCSDQTLTQLSITNLALTPCLSTHLVGCPHPPQCQNLPPWP